MVAVYAVGTVLGVVGIVGWIALGMAATAWQDKDHLDPEVLLGSRGRFVIAAVLGFGLGGMSASYAGWADGLAFVAALAGAGIGVASAHYLGFEEDADGGSA